jgi:hypothetical protein
MPPGVTEVAAAVSKQHRTTCLSHEALAQRVAIVRAVTTAQNRSVVRLHHTMSPPARSHFNLIVVSVAALVALAALLFAPTSAPAEPAVSWTPTSINQTVFAGESKMVSVSFVPSENSTNVAVRVVPELAPFVQATPSSFATVTKGQAVQLNLTFSAPATTLPSSFEGTIQLRSTGSKNSKTLARPLPLTINIAWQEFLSSSGSYRLLVPGTVAVFEAPAESAVALVPTNLDLQPGDAGYPGPVQFRMYQNPGRLAVGDYFNGDLAPDLFSGSPETTSALVGGRQATVFKNVQGLTASDVVVVILDEAFLEITTLQVNGASAIPLDQILQTIQFP